MFPTALIDELSSSELIQQLDEHIYNKLLSHFGEITKGQKQTKVQRCDKVDALRRKKKDLKKLRKELHKKGLKDTAADHLLTREWFATMREHSRLARSFREREAVIHNCQKQKQFKKNPMRFGKELFQKKSSGEPNFSSQVALDYFAKIYKNVIALSHLSQK